MNRLAIHEIDHHIQQLTWTYLSTDYLNILLQAASSKCLSPSATITTEFGATAALIWDTVWCCIEQPALAEDSLALLDTQLQRLCVVWAACKYRQPQSPLFKGGATKADVKAMWRHPEICTAINTATQHCQNDGQNDGQNAIARTRINQYPTCWAYVFGCVMYQLLQWNHSLTSYQLWELFEQSPAFTQAISPIPPVLKSAKQQYSHEPSQTICLTQAA